MAHFPGCGQPLHCVRVDRTLHGHFWVLPNPSQPSLPNRDMIKFLGHIGTLTSPSSHPDALTPRMNPNACFQSKILPAGGTKRGRGCLWKRNLKEGQRYRAQGTGTYGCSLPQPPHPKDIWILVQEPNVPSHHIMTIKVSWLPARRPRPKRGQGKKE